MLKRASIFTLGIAAVAVLSCADDPRHGTAAGSSSTADESAPPNILYIVVDTLRADHLGCYGYPRETSPFLDSLAAKSTLFEWALVQWPKTGPSMASMFTGTYGSFSGVARKTGKFKVPPMLETLPEVLQGDVYETLAVVSNSSLSRQFNYHHGFDKYKEHFYIESGSAAEISGKCKELLADRNRDKPYFMWAHFIDPHTPYEPPQGYAELFKGDELFEKTAGEPIPKYISKEETPGPKSVRQVPPEAVRGSEWCEQVRDYVVQYDAEIRYLDDQLKKWFDWLKSNGHLDNTIVVFTSDHGESLGDHDFYFEHGRYPYDACTRVPLFIHHPELEPAVIEEPVALLDVAPTLVEFVDLDLVFKGSGKSVAEWMRQGKATGEVRPVFTESGYLEKFCVALREGPWKLIYIPEQRLRKELRIDTSWQLFNVEKDPGETVNVADLHAEVFKRMKAVLAEEAARRHAQKGLAEYLEEGELDPVVLKNLRALGYIEE